MPLRLELNRSLDVRAYATAYAQRGIVHIADVLSPVSAEPVARILEQQISWQLALSETDDPQGGCLRYGAHQRHRSERRRSPHRRSPGLMAHLPLARFALDLK